MLFLIEVTKQDCSRRNCIIIVFHMTYKGKKMKVYNFTLVLILVLNTIFIINFFNVVNFFDFLNYSYIWWFILFIAGLVFSIKSLRKYRSNKNKIYLSVYGAKATIVGAYDTTAYAVTYTPTTGGPVVKNHKWVIESELSAK